jgi:LPXTG-motif cell wall-anchored protein
MKEKSLTILLCIIGVSVVSYGMIKDNDVIFIIGLLLVIGAYLLIRRKLKGAIKRKN